ncbi:Carbohydrate binding module (family 6) [Hydrobacter penzbergensis]|uniref:Carbohydrate binding module (Family 6) n=1 Tax=Hydrobacter penzbergensis TaxID=1235997 RepID=A0A8X8ICT6_9BACT|nr:cellulase family glycosylhydrolase [Hydrobacter penzbergensis]SDW17044.1 Carbohydrate binding module (family 6) [Hydrobacter penzbergensis]
MLLKSFVYRNFYIGLFMLLCCTAQAQGFLKVDGQKIVNDKDENVLLRSIGLGGWMIQEGYMLRLEGEGMQHKIKSRIEQLIGKQATDSFYHRWRKNHISRAEVDSLKAWGFNAIRLPMHFNLFTLPVDEEPVKGRHTWLKEGFQLVDSLLSWCKKAHIYLILDLHAAPGGQGNDLNIADRDASKPSLWESRENQLKTIALWEKIAQRYANEPWIGGYDLLNEPNWGFSLNPKDRNGIWEQHNEPLWNFLKEVATAVRKVDTRHLLIIEGNGWGNNYAGLPSIWDKNLCMSFHKYWNYNDQQSIKNILEARQRYNVPVWLGETGENSNVWFREAVALLEQNNIGWSWWPLKKMGVNNPLEVKVPADYGKVLSYWNGNGPKPTKAAAKKVFFQLAENVKLRNCLLHRDVLDALFRQVHSSETIPFTNHKKNNSGLIIYATDYDLGRSGSAYLDMDSADYHISSGGSWQIWNKGRVYRNDGVDIDVNDDPLSNGHKVTKMEDGEWLNYTFYLTAPATYYIRLRLSASAPDQKMAISVNGEAPQAISFNPVENEKQKWQTIEIAKKQLPKGKNSIRIYAKSNQMEFGFIQLTKL